MDKVVVDELYHHHQNNHHQQSSQSLPSITYSQLRLGFEGVVQEVVKESERDNFSSSSTETFDVQKQHHLPSNFNAFISSIISDLILPMSSHNGSNSSSSAGGFSGNFQANTYHSNYPTTLANASTALFNISQSLTASHLNYSLEQLLRGSASSDNSHAYLSQFGEQQFRGGDGGSRSNSGDVFDSLPFFNFPGSSSSTTYSPSTELARTGDSWLVTLVWSLLFYPLVVLAAAGNLLVIWIIATKPLMRTVMNRYLLNLTVSDFLSIFFNCGFFFYMMINEHWPFGKVYCVINNFIANLTLATSISTLSLISLDRYYAIVHPLRPRQSHRRLLLSIGAIWLFSALFSLPTLLYSETIEFSGVGYGPNIFDQSETSSTSSPLSSANVAKSLFSADYFRSGNFSGGGGVESGNIDGGESNWFPSSLLINVLQQSPTTSSGINETKDLIFGKHQKALTSPDVVRFEIDHEDHSSFYNQNHQLLRRAARSRTLCLLRWPDGVSGFSHYEFIYNVAFLILFYLIPLLTMVVALALMSRVLWPGERIGEPTLPQHALIRSKRKVVCMLCCIIIVFCVCWLPYHLYFISIYLWPSLIQTFGIKHIFLAFYFLAMSNSLLNILILFAMNRRIRNYIIHYLKFTCCLFRLQKRFSRTCRRSSLQMMMNNGTGKFQHPHHHGHHHHRQQLGTGSNRQTAELLGGQSGKSATHGGKHLPAAQLVVFSSGSAPGGSSTAARQQPQQIDSTGKGTRASTPTASAHHYGHKRCANYSSSNGGGGNGNSGNSAANSDEDSGRGNTANSGNGGAGGGGGGSLGGGSSGRRKRFLRGNGEGNNDGSSASNNASFNGSSRAKKHNSATLHNSSSVAAGDGNDGAEVEVSSSALWNHSSPSVLSSPQLAEAVSAAISSSYSCICKETATPTSSKWHSRICRCGSNGSATGGEACNCQPDSEFLESSTTPSSTYSQSDAGKDDQQSRQSRNRNQKTGSRFRIFRTWRQQHKHCPVHHHQQFEGEHCDQQSNLLTKSTWLPPLSSAEQPLQENTTVFDVAEGGGDSSMSFSLIQGKTKPTGNTAF